MREATVESPELTVGFIGLGNQGAPIAQRIVAAGWPLRIWARRPGSLSPFSHTPAVAMGSPEALAAGCDLVGICVVNDDDVRDVLLRDDGVLGAMKPGGIIAIHSTLLPATVIDLDERARRRGVHILDAPVSGGPKGAEAGTMTVMIGGELTVLERARPVLGCFATSIAHLGPVGSGQMMKLLNNNLAYVNLLMGIEALELAIDLGMNRRVVAEIIRVSSGASGGFGILTDDTLFAKISGPSSNLAKDVHHLAEIAHEHGLKNTGLLAVSARVADRIVAWKRRIEKD
jgi:3-hydroxyisobutyrate dehydrogenase-like beta-hydroxyacid dehydrogenase